jgi:hypothetical protein
LLLLPVLLLLITLHGGQRCSHRVCVPADLIACDGPVCDVERPLGDKNLTEMLYKNI